MLARSPRTMFAIAAFLAGVGTPFLATGIPPAHASMFKLHEFLREVEVATHAPVVLRADGSIDVQSPGKSFRDEVVILQQPNGNRYIEFRHMAVRALLFANGMDAVIVPGPAQSPRPFPLGTSLAGSDFVREDLRVFRAARYPNPKIADRNRRQVTVMLPPSPGSSHYALVVTTFDREKKIPVKILYYEDTTNNLVKMRRDEGHVLVGRQWLPTRITLQHFQLHTKSRLELHWRQDEDVGPEIFQPESLSRPSLIAWNTSRR